LWPSSHAINPPFVETEGIFDKGDMLTHGLKLFERMRILALDICQQELELFDKPH
jgi:hypothetical protein